MIFSSPHLNHPLHPTPSTSTDQLHKHRHNARLPHRYVYCTSYRLPTGMKQEVTSPVLFRLKQGVTPAQIATWTQTAQAMVGKIPGLISLKANPPLPICVPRAKGFDMGLVAVLETPKDVEAYAVHPAHLE